MPSVPWFVIRDEHLPLLFRWGKPLVDMKRIGGHDVNYQNHKKSFNSILFLTVTTTHYGESIPSLWSISIVWCYCFYTRQHHLRPHWKNRNCTRPRRSHLVGSEKGYRGKCCVSVLSWMSVLTVAHVGWQMERVWKQIRSNMYRQEPKQQGFRSRVMQAQCRVLPVACIDLFVLQIVMATVQFVSGIFSPTPLQWHWVATVLLSPP